MDKSKGTLDQFVIRKSDSSNKKRKAEATEEKAEVTNSKSKKVSLHFNKEKNENNQLVSSSSSFPSFETFTNDLDTWTTPLKDYIKTNKMIKIYNYVKPAYESTTVILI
jgi:hypothetical protein